MNKPLQYIYFYSFHKFYWSVHSTVAQGYLSCCSETDDWDYEM